MIQRIQTVFLALTIILNIVFLFFPILGEALADPAVWVAYLLIAGVAISAGISGYSIFLYNDRKKQISWVKMAMLPQLVGVGATVGIFFSMGRISSLMLPEAVAVGLLVLGLIAQYLAIHFIKKDEKLVRSMDRIR